MARGTKSAGRNRGQITQDRPGKFRARIYRGQDAEGKRTYTTVGTFDTFKKAQVALADALTKQESQTFVEPSKALLSDYLTAWDAGHLCRTARTKRGYSERLPRIIKALGSVRINQLTREDVKSFYVSLVADGLSGRTIEMTHRTLRKALAEAVLSKRLLHNPTDSITLPTGSRKTAKQKAISRAWTPEQIDQFLAANRDSRDYACFVCFLDTGARPGEVFGFQWPDLTNDASILNVRRTVTEPAGGQYEVVEEAKTGHSLRSITTTQRLRVVLAAHRRTQIEEMMKAGPEYQRQGFMFCQPDGTFYTKSSFRSRWKAACKRASVPEIPPYGARHTHATLLLSRGVNAKVVAERLGNSVEVVMSTYAHVLPTMQEAALKALEA
jgi:integrase